MKRGVGRDGAVATVSPSSPALFSPQQATERSAVCPHVCPTPALIDVSLIGVDTAVGAARSTNELSPSCPTLLSPQQYAVPSAVSAQV